MRAACRLPGNLLVTFPAARTIFTDPTSTACPNTVRCLFIPQVGRVTARSSARRSVAARNESGDLAGSSAASSRCFVLILSQGSSNRTKAVAFPRLLVATAFLGEGCRPSVPSLNR